MYCTRCGKEFDADSKFCIYCGTKVADRRVKNDAFKCCLKRKETTKNEKTY